MKLKPLKLWDFKLRLTLLYLVFLSFLGLVALRLFKLQVLPNPELESLSQKQFQLTAKKSPYRLSIYDRHGEELALSIPTSSVYARPRLLNHKRKTARSLAELLGGTSEKWLQKLESQKPFVWLQRQVPNEVARLLLEKGIEGIFIESENKRVYPHGSLASHVLGFTDIDGNGIAGLELVLNGELLQESSKLSALRDGRGKPSYLDKRYFLKETQNRGVYLTLDRRVQNIVEEEIEKTAKTHKAKMALGFVLEPYSGEIYAMGQYPAFDGNSIAQASPTSLTFSAISHLFEPGSTLKSIFAAEAIERGLMQPNTMIDCEGGRYKIAHHTIKEANLSHQFKMLSLENVLKFSSNVGAIKIAQALGVEGTSFALEKFGFVKKTQLPLPGEISAGVKPKSFWTPFHLATTSFGQGISVTPLQMVMAYTPFANGGYLVRPKILLHEDTLQPRNSLDVKRVLSPATAKTMKNILMSVIEEKNGTAASAKSELFKAAGKTGTAQKFEGEKGYGGGKYFSSFIGFLPADRPELLIGVMVDEPQDEYYATKIAAPLFKRIAERTMQILDRLPKHTIKNTDPAAWAKTTIPVVKPGVNSLFPMPDLKGVSVREATEALAKIFKQIEIQGSGYLVSQQPVPDAWVQANTPVVLQFSNVGN